MKNDIKYFDRDGSIFTNRGLKRSKEDQVTIDMSHVRLLHTCVDTYRPIYEGLLDVETLKILDAHLEKYPGDPIVFGSFDFLVSKSGKNSGYSYMLRNARLGVVVLLKSFYADQIDEGSHLKMEFSPHALHNVNPIDVDQLAIDIASIFMSKFRFKACGIHLAADLKGWLIPDNLERSMKCKAKRMMNFQGIDNAEFDLASCSVRYGSNESYTFGSTTSVQCAIYDKVKESKHSGKYEYISNLWSLTPGVDDPFVSEYESGDNVTRIEARFHHTTVQQFCKGTKGMVINSFVDICYHLNGLWQYFLHNFRLHQSPKFVHPLWQILRDDVQFYAPCKPLLYQRSYTPGEPKIKRNVAFFIGNALRVFNYKNMSVEHIVKWLWDSGVTSELRRYLGVDYESTDSEARAVLHEFIRERMDIMRLSTVA